MLKDLPKSLIEAAKALKVDVKSNSHSSNLRKREKEIAASHEANVKEETEVTEALKGNQHKIDADKDGKIEKSDFATLRKKKMKEGYVSDAQRKAVWAARNDKGVKEELEVSEAAKSDAQQRAAGAALATQQGKYDGGKKGGAINRMSMMKKKDLVKLAKKKETNEEVQFSDEELARIQEIINGTTDK